MEAKGEPAPEEPLEKASGEVANASLPSDEKDECPVPVITSEK